MNFGQARLVAHPKFFMNQSVVRMHVVSADPTFHEHRPKYQEQLALLLEEVFDDPTLRLTAARGIYGGSPPADLRGEEKQRSKSCCRMQ